MERKSPKHAGRRRAVDPPAIRAALDAGEPVRLILLDEDSSDPQVLELARLGASLQIPLWRGSPGDLHRMSPENPPARALALLGPDPKLDLAGLLAEGGAIWLLHRAAYPSNVGFTIRTAEVSGAAGVVVDAMFNHAERSRVSHVSMGAHRLLPVLWESTRPVLKAARAAGHRIIAVEDTGSQPPWQAAQRGHHGSSRGQQR